MPYPFTTQQTGPYGSVVIGPTIAADGTMFQVVSSLDLAFTPSPCSDFLSSVKMTLYLSQTAPDGSVTFTPFHTETSLIPDSYPFPRGVTVPQCYPRCTDVGEIPPNEQLPTDITFRVIPDGQGGALVPWWKDLGYYTTFEAHVTHVSSSGISDVVLPLNYQNTAIQNSNVCPFNPGQLPCIADFRLVLGENGVAFATDLKSVVALNIASMTPIWSYSSPAGMDLIAAAAGNGLVAKVTDQNGIDTVVRFDSSGNPTLENWTASKVDYWAGNLWPAVPTSGGPITGYSAGLVEFSNSEWFSPDQEGSHQAVQNLNVTNFSNAGPNQATITSVLQKLQAALPSNNSCNNWLQGSGSNRGRGGLQQIQDILSTNFFGHGTVNLGTIPYYKNGAFSGSVNRDKTPIPGLPPPPSPIFTVNDIGAFFNAADAKGRPFEVGRRGYAGNTLRAQATILVHEIAHQITVSGFQSDFGIPKAGGSKRQVGRPELPPANRRAPMRIKEHASAALDGLFVGPVFTCCKT